MYLTDLVRALPFKETKGTDNYKKLLKKQISFGIISFNADSLFKNTVLVNDELRIGDLKIKIFGTDLHFPQGYIVPIPQTIGDFIDMMYMLNVELYWSDKIIEQLEPIDYLYPSKLPDYFKELLTILDKENEITF